MILSAIPSQRQDNVANRLGFVLQVIEFAQSGGSVVVKGVCLPKVAGADYSESQFDADQSVEILVMTSHEGAEQLLKILGDGVRDCRFKPVEAKEVMLAISSTNKEGLPVGSPSAPKADSSLRAPVLTGPAATILSGREKEILTQLSRGDSNKAIAAQMHISLSTVRTHLRHIYQKLEVRSRTEAVVRFASVYPELFSNELRISRTNEYTCKTFRNSFKLATQ